VGLATSKQNITLEFRFSFLRQCNKCRSYCFMV